MLGSRMVDIKTRQDKTRQGKTRQDKTRQDKTRQDKSRQGKARQGTTPGTDRHLTDTDKYRQTHTYTDRHRLIQTQIEPNTKIQTIRLRYFH